MNCCSSVIFQNDELRLRRIVELEAPFMKAMDMLPGLTQEVLNENRPWLAPLTIDHNDFFKLCFQSFIVETPHHRILIDSCIGNHKNRPNAPWHQKSDTTYIDALVAHGLGVGDIDYVLCTHLHFDHVGWNTRLADGRWVPTFPNAKYIFGRKDFDDLMAGRTQISREAFEDSVLPIVQAGQAELVDGDFCFGDHIRALETPGHTLGHLSFCFGRKRDDLVMTGDLLHVPLQMKYPELSFIRDADPVLAAKTRRSFLERYSETSTLCCTAHFMGMPVGHIRTAAEGFDFHAIASKI